MTTKMEAAMKKQNEKCSWSTSFLIGFSFGNQAHGMVPPIGRVDLPDSVTLMKVNHYKL